MRILITNDDGINAPGLATLTAIAHDVAGPDGEVWTVAPAFEQSYQTAATPPKDRPRIACWQVCTT
jgi:broad specificity polyphosphatase/5'/3'-nucleotidase SurE